MLSPLVWSNAFDLVDSVRAQCKDDTLLDNTHRSIEKHHMNYKPKFVEALMKICQTQQINISYVHNPLKSNHSMASEFVRCKFDWSLFPEAISVSVGGQLPSDRVRRKEQQLNNIMCFAAPFLVDGARVVDFCCGCGHQSIPLAYLFPNCHFILADMNAVSLNIARERCQQ
jgi:2-polyprenyl-3-methyl-5-hydroxy-6-metoxy-1,4-benzoquinol methylase